ncbi:hypothetical protein AB0G87_32565 [Streptomyces asoensis]|uniref:hypothetical protein n=1 Tax=Streptomyces asoensis TaxID=249586 RepID=UPI0034065AB0
MTTQAPERRQGASGPVLENFYTVFEAAVRLKPRDADDPTTKGEKVLRDGVNKHD